MNIESKFKLWNHDDYEIIEIIESKVKYKPKKLNNSIFNEIFVDYDEIEIPLGKSRIGGPIVDLPENLVYPEEMYFVAQLNMLDLKEYDINSLLPDSGFLYVFINDSFEGQVLYSDRDVTQLTRHIKEHEGQFFYGCLVEKFEGQTENIREKYDEEWAREGEKIGWDCFAGFEKSKFFGFYNNCQLTENEMYEKSNERKILLLQIGENFTEEGILSVLIDVDDLIEKKFENCIIEWNQS